MTTNNSSNIPTGASGTVLRGGGVGSASVFSTATYPDTTTINRLLYSSNNNVIADLATANSAVLVTTSAGVPVLSGTMTDGQLIIGDTSGTPVAASLTAGANITITPGAGSIEIAAAGGGASAATQADQETGSSTSVYVSPGRQQYHASASKFWVMITVAAGTPSVTVGYNAASITDLGVGNFGINYTVNFSSANYSIVGSSNIAGSGYFVIISTLATSSAQVYTTNNAGTPADPTDCYFVGYGDQ